MNNLFACASWSLLAISIGGCSVEQTKDPNSKPRSSSLTIELATKWDVGPDTSIGKIAAASVGEEAAIVYAESEGWTDQGFTQTRIKLQRMVKTGALVGATVELGVIPFDYATEVTVASDGVRYLACWRTGDTIACATVPLGQGDAAPAYSGQGHSPSLAYGPNGFALARNQPDQLTIVYLDETGTAAGSDIVINAVGAEKAAVLLKATSTGYVLTGETDGTMRLHTLNDSLTELVAPVNLDRGYWFSAAIATANDVTAVHLAKPYGGTLFVRNAMAVQKTYEYDDTNVGKAGLVATLAVDEATFGVLSIDGNGGFRYGRVGAANSAPPSEVVFNFNGVTGNDAPLAIVDIQEERFFVTASGWSSRGGSLAITRLIRN